MTVRTGRLGALLLLQLREYLRDPLAAGFSFFFPLFFLVSFGMTSATTAVPPLRIALLTSTEADALHQIEATIAGLPSVRIRRLSLREATQQLQDGELDAFVRQGRGPRSVEVVVPAGRERLATTIAQGLQLQQYRDAGIRPSVNVFTATLEGPARNAFDFVAPALLALALSQLGLFGTGNQILIARARGQLQRLRCTTLSGLEIIVSQITVRLGMAVVQVGLLLLAAHLAFGFSIQGSGYQLVLTGFLGAVTLSVLGYAIGGLAPTLESGTAAIMLVNFFMMFCGQVFFDLRRDQHAAVQALTYANPVSYLSDSFREVIVGQPSTLGYWPNQLIVAGWLLLFVVVALFGFKYQMDQG